jgi:hypothetical protein
MGLFVAGFLFATLLSATWRVLVYPRLRPKRGGPTYREIAAARAVREQQWHDWSVYAMGVARPAGIVLPNPPPPLG